MLISLAAEFIIKCLFYETKLRCLAFDQLIKITYSHIKDAFYHSLIVNSLRQSPFT